METFAADLKYALRTMRRNIGVTAIALAKAGYDVAAMARDQVRLDDVRSQIAKHGVRAFAVDCEECGSPLRANELFGTKIRRD